jgi:hypothetical protein
VQQIGDQPLWGGKGGFVGFKDDPELAKSILASLSPFKAAPGRPTPEAPPVDGQPAADKFAEVGEAAYEPEKKPAGWMAPTEEKKEAEFAKAAPTRSDAEFRTAVLSGQRWQAKDFPGKTPKDALDIATKYNHWKKEYEAKYNEWKEKYEAQPDQPVEPPAPPCGTTTRGITT